MTKKMRWTMPAEWAPHDRCYLAWPARLELWANHLDRAKAEYAATIDAIAAFEPVTVICNPGDQAEVRSRCSQPIEVLELPIDDSWTRDNAPIFVVDASNEIVGIDFVFNSWGEKFAPWQNDSALGEQLLEAIGTQRIVSAMVLEGGSIAVDGEGTLITTEQCLLHESRNPSMTRSEIEHELEEKLGITTVIWLPWGPIEDDHTDGHVDLVAAFIAPGKVVAQACSEPDHPNFARMTANLESLRAVTDARGRQLEITEIPFVPRFELDGEEVVGSYLNFYIANGGVVVPIYDVPHDDDALEIYRGLFPDREVVGVLSRVIAFGGGGTHCITQQLPAAG